LPSPRPDAREAVGGEMEPSDARQRAGRLAGFVISEL